MKKKCLIIIPGIPYPPIDGHKLKIFNIIKILSKHFELHIVTIASTGLSLEESSFIKSHSYRNAHFKISKFTAFFRMVTGLFSKTPLQIKFFTLKSASRYLKADIDHYSFVFFNLVRTSAYLHLYKNNCTVFDMVDSLAISYLRSRKKTSSLLHRAFYTLEAKRLLAYEKATLSQVDVTLSVNYEEARLLGKYGKVSWIPNGVNPALFHYTARDPAFLNCFAFFGTMYYQPNIDAVKWFDKYVLDFIDPRVKLYIIGARPTKEVQEIANRRSNIMVTGFLEDPYVILNSCFCVIAPMQTGGGIQNKVLETMALGKVNVLTTYGAKPIKGATTNEHFIVRDSPTLMAEVINDIYMFPNKYNIIGKNAKKLILENYTWAAYESSLLRHLS